MAVLLTGGTGYIGSHTAVALIEAGYEIILFDNLSNSRLDILDKISAICGRSVPFIAGDLRDQCTLDYMFLNYKIESVIHFAGLKSVSESLAQPDYYFDNNVSGTLNLLRFMSKYAIRNFVFSSSATVYGEPKYLPIDEGHPRSATNPYGRSKLILEDMLSDLAAANPSWRFAILRYFNPVGAHASGLIGEDPNGIPSNLMPYISRVAAKRLPELTVFGDDYDTHDGTGIRDFIHVEDLASGHISALKALERRQVPISTWNLGTGQGYSVLEMVRAFEQINGVKVPFRIAPRRPGDVAACYASPIKAREDMGWEASRGLDQMCQSVWRFERMLKSAKLD